MNGRAIVVIPTYNEAVYIEKLISRILFLHPGLDILVVDDNSPDGTGGIVEKLSSEYSRVKILRRSKKFGLGAAYLTGFKYILSQETGYEKIIQMDADFSHDPQHLNDLLRVSDEYDIAIGSRYVQGANIVKWGVHRRILSYAANLYLRFWFKSAVKDSTSGFRCFRRAALNGFGFEKIRSNGYLFQIELLYRVLNSGYTFKEIPITFVERKAGKTKLGAFQVLEAVLLTFAYIIAPLAEAILERNKE